MKKVAIVCAPGLGDGLIFMVLSHNFFLSGYEVTTFSNPLVELKNFFPEHTILPFPDKSHYFQIFSLFDQVIAADYSILAESIEWNNLCVLKESGFDRKKTMIENLAHLCRERFQLPYFSKHNGLTLSNVQFRKYPNRIIIHPTSLDDKKTWAKPKFLSLTEQLIKNEWDPVICVSPKERKDWENVISKKNISNTGGLDELLTFI
jgi:heptosyltransferase-3